MKRLLAAVLLCTVFASPTLAAKKPHKEPHQKYNYRYKAPKKIKAPKGHHRHASHPHSAHKSQSV
jgi:hypothetical protein